MIAHLNAPSVQPKGPTGATLVEVLMSLLIMSIGIISVFTLFPVSLLSSIKSNQLTSARLFADQITQTVNANPRLLLGAPEWKPFQSYNVGDIVTDVSPPGFSYPNNGNYYILTDKANSSDVSGGSTPIWQNSVPQDGNLSWATRYLPTARNDVGRFVSGRFMLDPYGYILGDQTYPYVFGNLDYQPLPQDRIFRANCNIVSPAVADRMGFCSPDTWTVENKAFPLSVTVNSNGTTTLLFPSSVDLSALAAASLVDPTIPILSRVVALSPNGRLSASGVIVNNPGDNTLTVDSELFGGDISNYGEVRLESFSRRYTWLAAVHRDGGGYVNAQYAIVFNRSYRPDDEHLYAYEVKSGLGDEVVVSHPTGGNSPQPTILVGGYVFDCNSVRWYRIVNVTPGLDSTDVTIDRELEFSNRTNGYMMFLPGIVRVFPLD